MALTLAVEQRLEDCLGNQGCAFLRIRLPLIATKIMTSDTSIRRS